MNFKALHKTALLPTLWLTAFAVASAVAQKPVMHIEVNHHDTIEFAVTEWPGDRYTWDLYDDPTLNFALEHGRLDPAFHFVNGMYEGNSVQVTNLPPGFYIMRVVVWDEVNCTNNLMVHALEISEVPEANLYGDEACFGAPTCLRVVFTGVGPWDIMYTEGDVVHAVNLMSEKEKYFFISPNTMEPIEEVISKEYWINYIKDKETEGENFED